MRKILFRGQTRRYGEKVRMGDGFKLPSRWVYGGVLQGVSAHSIIYGGENADDPGEGLEKWVVYTDTLGQFTGLTDKNGKKIFEGDILRFMAYGTVYTGKVEFLNGAFWVKCRFHDRIGAIVHKYKPEIIGNIHDNPELLEVCKDGSV